MPWIQITFRRESCCAPFNIWKQIALVDLGVEIDCARLLFSCPMGNSGGDPRTHFHRKYLSVSQECFIAQAVCPSHAVKALIDGDGSKSEMAIQTV
jgi:hypothetical protein